jgi:hypothetical protein
MADVFREVDEDLRREQLKKLWDRFAPYILGVAVLIVLGVSAYKIVEFWQRSQAEGSGDRFIAALNLSDQGKPSESIAALQALANEGSGAYPVLARFRIASEKADSGDINGAVADYDQIAARGDVPVEVRNMARIRAALLLIDTATVTEVTRRVGDLAAVGNPWRHNAREALALASWRAGDLATAKSWFDQINADQESPADMRQRATVMLSLIAAKQTAASAPPAAASAASATPAPTASSVVPGPAAPATPAKPEG